MVKSWLIVHYTSDSVSFPETRCKTWTIYCLSACQCIRKCNYRQAPCNNCVVKRTKPTEMTES